MCWDDDDFGNIDDDLAWISAPYTPPEPPASVSQAWTDEASRRAAMLAQEEAAAANAEEVARQAAVAEQQADRRRTEESSRRAAEAARRQAEENASRKAAEAARRQAEEVARQAAVAERVRQAEENASRKAAEAARRQAEENASRKAAEAARRQAEENASREAAEAARRQAEEVARQAAVAERVRQAEENASREAAEAARRKAEEASRQAAMLAQQEADRRRKAAAERRAQAARRNAEEDARRRADRAAAALRDHHRRMELARLRVKHEAESKRRLRERARKALQENKVPDAQPEEQTAAPKAAVRKEALSLFQELKGYILNKLNTDNVAVLSSIANIQNENGTHDLLAIDDALLAIQKHFNTFETMEDRRTLYNVYSARILIENAEQLVDNYNRIIQNTRRLFPEFNLIREGHNGIFSKLASLKCQIRRCSDEEIASQIQDGNLQHVDISDNDLEREYQQFKKYYQTRFVDTPNGQARTLGDEYGWVLSNQVLSSNLARMIDYSKYSGNGFINVNAILRSDKSTARFTSDMVESFNRFAHHLVIPMYSKDDFVIYRGDGLTTSDQTQTVMGFYSAGLSPVDIGKFVRDGGRMIKIHVPRGTPFLPIVLTRKDEGEIALLPGTVLEKQSQMTLDNGHYAEYTVASNPPVLSEREEATIFMNSIALLYDEAVYEYKHRGPGTAEERERFVNERPTAGAPTAGEAEEFVLNLVNSRYDGDW